MQTLFERSEVIKSYDRAIKILKNGFVEIKMYDNGITYLDNSFEKTDKSFSIICDCRRPIINPNKELAKDIIKKDDIKDTELKEIRSDSLSRTRQTLIDYACENNEKFHSFITLTFGDEITEVSRANHLFNNFISQWTRLKRKQGEQFYYLGVPEFQKSGRVHYHVLTNLKHDVDIMKKEPIKTYNKSKHKYYTIEYYDIRFWKYGYSSSFDLDSQTDDNFNIALYITKYLYKDLDKRLFGKKKILKSNNLVKPNVYKLDKDDITYKCAMEYIRELLLDKKSDVQSINRIEKTEDKPYIKSQSILQIKLQDKDNILKDILQANLEF